MRAIPEKLLAIPTLLSLGNSSGSGFIYRSDKFIYLVTAKHVLFDNKDELRNNELELVYQTININDESVTRIRIDLSLIKHMYHKVCDACIVQIGKIKFRQGHATTVDYLSGVERLETGYSEPTITGRNKTLLLEDVSVSNDIYVFGYPTSLGLKSSPQFDYNKPLIRRGIVANVFKSAKTIILDCSVYPGNSGGPVIQSRLIDNKIDLNLIGIISQNIPYVQSWKNERDKIEHIEYLNSGYSVATSFDAILELIDLIEQK